MIESMVLNTPSTTLFFVILIGLIWLVILTVLLFRALSNYNRLTHGISEKTLSQVLNDFLDKDQKVAANEQKIFAEVKKLNLDSLKFLQKIGLVRFNPFSDTGGDQSFVIALLDGRKNGIVITSLYARTGTRWYVKKIKEGEGIEYDLSKEEKEAIKKAS